MDPNQQLQSSQKEINPPIELTPQQVRQKRAANAQAMALFYFTIFSLLLLLLNIAIALMENFGSFRLALFFILGVFAQAFFMIHHKLSRINILKFAGCILLSLFLMIPIVDPSTSSIIFLLIPIFFFFSIFFPLIFKREILYRINEGVLVIWNTVFLYKYFLELGFYDILTPIVIALTIVSFIMIIPRSAPKFWGKVFLYCWLLFIMIFLLFYQFDAGLLAQFIEGLPSVSYYSPLNAVLNGMISLSIMSYLSFIAAIFIPLIPFKMNLGDVIFFNSELYNFNHRWERIKKTASDLSNKYDDKQLSLKKIIFLTSITSGGLIINYYYKFIPEYIVINIIIVILFNFLEFTKTPDLIGTNQLSQNIIHHPQDTGAKEIKDLR